MKAQKLSHYAVLYFEEDFYFFGGTSGEVKFLSNICRFNKELKWSKVGELVSRRTMAGVVFDGLSFLVVGGWGFT